MNIGDKAPELLGTDQDGKEIKLSDYKGKKIVLYFYPKDSTPGCTSQACSLRDNYELMQKRGYAVIGVSVQDEKSHKKFIEKYNLPFPLIADVDKTRTTFIINEEGVIEEIFTPKQIKVKEHAEQILKLGAE